MHLTAILCLVGLVALSNVSAGSASVPGPDHVHPPAKQSAAPLGESFHKVSLDETEAVSGLDSESGSGLDSASGLEYELDSEIDSASFAEVEVEEVDESGWDDTGIDWAKYTDWEEDDWDDIAGLESSGTSPEAADQEEPKRHGPQQTPTGDAALAKSPAFLLALKHLRKAVHDIPRTDRRTVKVPKIGKTRPDVLLATVVGAFAVPNTRNIELKIKYADLGTTESDPRSILREFFSDIAHAAIRTSLLTPTSGSGSGTTYRITPCADMPQKTVSALVSAGIGKYLPTRDAARVLDADSLDRAVRALFGRIVGLAVLHGAVFPCEFSEDVYKRISLRALAAPGSAAAAQEDSFLSGVYRAVEPHLLKEFLVAAVQGARPGSLAGSLKLLTSGISVLDDTASVISDLRNHTLYTSSLVGSSDLQESDIPAAVMFWQAMLRPESEDVRRGFLEALLMRSDRLMPDGWKRFKPAFTIRSLDRREVVKLIERSNCLVLGDKVPSEQSMLDSLRALLAKK